MLFIHSNSILSTAEISLSNIGLCTFASSGERRVVVSEELSRLGSVLNACSSHTVLPSQ